MSLTGLAAWLDRVPRRLRVPVLAAIVVTILVFVGWAAGVGREQYVPLFSKLQPVDAADIVSALEADGIPYKLEGNGTAVSVPASMVHRTRLELAGRGLPQGGVVGYELLDQSRLGSTEFERRVNYYRALEGELTRTIGQIDGVEQARVHLVIPESTLFVADRKQPTAGVLVGLQAGSELDGEQVKGIVHLVSRSVEGLSPDSVTVIDTFGRILSSTGSTRAAPSVTVSQMDTQLKFEDELKRRLESLLGQVFGPGNAIAQVAAQLNFDERVVERNLFIPAEDRDGLVRSIREVEEHFSGDGGMPGGIPGTVSNVGEPPTYQAVGGAGSSTYERREVVKETEFSRTYEHLTVAPGTLDRLTVAVVLNRALTAAEGEMVESIVKAAIGFDGQRRDEIIVTGIEFDTTLADQFRESLAADAAAEAVGRRQKLMASGGLALLVVCVLAVALRRRPRASRKVLDPMELVHAKSRQGLSGDLDISQPQKDLDRMIRQRPETVVHVLRTWLAEE